MLAAWLARSHTEHDLAALNDVVQAAREAAIADDRREFGLAASLFHRTIVERAGNTTLSLYSQLLHDLVESRYVLGALGATQRLMHRAVRSYAKLVVLIDAGDDDGARTHWQKQMTYMIEESEDDLITFYDEQTSLGPGRHMSAGTKRPRTAAAAQPR